MTKPTDFKDDYSNTLDASEYDSQFEVGVNLIRPQHLVDFVGQDTLKQHLSIFIKAAKSRGEPIDHVLLSGPPGMGKTSLSTIIANELQANLRRTSGPVLERASDLAAILSSLEAHDVLFIDEIHRMNKVVEETLYSALEDFKLDIIVGEGIGANTVRLDLPKFTLVGATTRSGLLSAPLRDRFGIIQRIEYYSVQELSQIVVAASLKLNTPIPKNCADEIAKRARGTPRIAIRLLKRIRDYFVEAQSSQLNAHEISNALEDLGVDENGLDALDRNYLSTIGNKFAGGPVGIANLSASLNEEIDSLEEVTEPYLIREGYLQRTSRGRVLTQLGANILNITLPDHLRSSYPNVNLLSHLDE